MGCYLGVAMVRFSLLSSFAYHIFCTPVSSCTLFAGCIEAGEVSTALTRVTCQLVQLSRLCNPQDGWLFFLRFIWSIDQLMCMCAGLRYAPQIHPPHLHATWRSQNEARNRRERCDVRHRRLQHQGRARESDRKDEVRHGRERRGVWRGAGHRRAGAKARRGAALLYYMVSLLLVHLEASAVCCGHVNVRIFIEKIRSTWVAAPQYLAWHGALPS